MEVYTDYIIDTTDKVAREVMEGRRKAHEKHGDNSIEAIPSDDPRWLSILMEEVGELAHENTYDATGSKRAEMLDVATVITAWIAAYDRENAVTTVPVWWGSDWSRQQIGVAHISKESGTVVAVIEGGDAFMDFVSADGVGNVSIGRSPKHLKLVTDTTE